MSTLLPARDAATMLRRNVKHTLRSPDTMIMSVALPVVILLLFVYIFGGAMHVGTAYLNYVVPGVILLCAGFGAATTATAVAVDLAEGIVDRFRTMNIARSSVLTGHVAASLLRNLTSTAVVIGVAVAMGFRPTAGPLAWLGAIGTIAAFIVAISWVSVALGLLARNPEAAQGFTFGFMFLPYVSSAFVPVETLPSWLRGFAEHQPVTPVIETVRGLLMGTATGDSPERALLWCGAIAAVGYVAATVLFARRGSR